MYFEKKRKKRKKNTEKAKEDEADKRTEIIQQHKYTDCIPENEIRLQLHLLVNK